MRRHPVIGYELLKGIPGIEPEILDGVRHHHEYLDGTGYPDALLAPEISDLVRLLTISDIFAALIELRPYRPAMSRENAYEILCGMKGKLEQSLREGVPEGSACGVSQPAGVMTALVAVCAGGVRDLRKWPGGCVRRFGVF